MSGRKRVVIIGGAGFVARYVRPLLWDYSVDLVDCVSPDELKQNETFHQLDLGHEDAIRGYIQKLQLLGDEVCGVLFLAAFYDFSNAPDSRYGAVTKGLKSILQGIRGIVPATAPLVYASSMAAIRPVTVGRRNTPDGPRVATWAYPESKLECEKVLESENWGRPIVELVLAAVYSDSCELITVYHMIEGIRQSRSKRLFYPGNLRHGLTFVHVEDAASAFMAALTRRFKSGEVRRFLIGESEPVPYEKIHQRATVAFGLPQTSLIRVPKALAKSGVKVLDQWSALMGLAPDFVKPWMIDHVDDHFHFDLSLTVKELGWKPQHTFMATLPKMLAMATRSESAWHRVNQMRPGFRKK